MSRWALVPLVIALLLGMAPEASRAQGAVPAAPAPPAPPPAAATPPATICSTEWGWCPLRVVAMPGAPCECVVPPATRLPGTARYWPYRGEVDPHLNPHVGPPSRIR